MVPRGQWDLPLRGLHGQSGRAVGTGALTLRAGPLGSSAEKSRAVTQERSGSALWAGPGWGAGAEAEVCILARPAGGARGTRWRGGVQAIPGD